MKTAIYIVEGTAQLVLSPENEWEKNVVRAIEDGDKQVTIKRGSFYECRGGWFRQGAEESDLIIRLDVRRKDDYGVETIPQVTP